MAKDYKPRQSAQNKGGSFFSGLLLGLVLGVGACVALTLYLKSENNPFFTEQNDNVVANPLPAPKVTETTVQPGDKDAPEIEDPNKYDFYTILPETESKVTESEIKNNTTIKKDSYFLQVGAFENENDADNMKAKLAIQGFETVVQVAEIPKRGIWHRVRVGPLTDVNQINKTRRELSQKGFNADLIKVRTETKTE